MFSIEKNSLESPPKATPKATPTKVESSNTYNKQDHKCSHCYKYYRRCRCNIDMYNSCNNILKVIMVLIIIYMIFRLMCNKQEEPSFKLVKRY